MSEQKTKQNEDGDRVRDKLETEIQAKTHTKTRFGDI